MRTQFELIQFPPGDRQWVRPFLALPFEIYRDIPQWVPPLRVDARKPLDPRNPVFAHAEAAFFLALEAGQKPLGRLAVIENRHYNQFNQERTAFFWLFEAINDLDVSSTLFEAAIAWAKARGLDQIIGPKGFSAIDGAGLLVKGFEHRPAFGLPYNPPYYPQLIEAAGFERQGDSVSGYLPGDTRLPGKIHQIAERVKQRRGLHVANFQTRRDLRALVPKLLQLYNDALGGTQGNVPLTQAEADAIAAQLIWFADPKLIKVVYKDEQPVGFLFAYPDVSAAQQRSGGRLLPFGWLDLLRERKRTQWVNVNGAGIVEQYRGLGGTAILFSEMERSIQAGGFAHADLVQIGVENDKMQRELRDLGIDFYKTHRVYARAI